MLDSVFFFFFFCSHVHVQLHGLIRYGRATNSLSLKSSFPLFFFSLAPVLFSIFAVLLLHLVVVLTAVLI